MQGTENKIKKPSLAFALLTLAVLVMFVVVTYSVLNMPILISLFFSWLPLTCCVRTLGYSLKQVEAAIVDMIKVGAGLFALLLAVGCMIAVWLSAGTVPTLIYWGLKVITPKIFLVVAFTVCSLVGLATGTSMGTASTVGVAMVGIGIGLGVPGGMVAGAIISGSCLGCICSPVSDGPLLSATVCNVDILKHCKHQISVALPAYVLAAAAFLIMGLTTVNGQLDTALVSNIMGSISEHFNVGIVTFIPLLVVVTLLVLRKPATTSIMIASLVGVAVAVFYQGYSISDMGTFLASGFKISTGNAYLDPILNRGGISSMMNLIAIVIASLGMGGIMKDCGIIDALVESLNKHIKGRVGLTNAALVGNLVCDSLVAANYFANVMNNTLLCPMYKKFGYAPENSSRMMCFLSITMCDFIPWSMNGGFYSSTLGVPTAEYRPFLLFHIFAVIILAIYGYTGFTMKKLAENEQAEQ